MIFRFSKLFLKKVCCCRGSNPSLSAVTYPVSVRSSNDYLLNIAQPVSVFQKQSFRFSRGDRRCSCSSSTRRYSCSSKRPPRSRSHCCSNDPAHGRWDSLPFTHYVLLRRFALYVKTWSRDGSYKPPPLYAFQSTSSSFSISPKKQSRPP